MNNKIDWIFFVAGRFGTADTKGRSALTSVLSSLGIAFGVVALIVILSVMNGFQMGYIESILEVSSAHIRITGSSETMEKIRKLPEVRSLSVFTESQSIMQGKFGSQQGVLLRAVEPDIITTDTGFASSAKIIEGSFDLSQPN